MPKLPRVGIASSKLSTQALSPDVSPNVAGMADQGMQEIGKGLAHAGKVWQDAIDTTQLLTAQNNIDEMFSEVFNNAAQDPGLHNNVNKYKKELEDSYNKSLKGFSSNIAQENFKKIGQAQLLESKIKIDGLGRKSFIDFSKAETIRKETVELKNFFNGDNEAKDRYINFVKAQQSVRIHSAEQAAELIADTEGWDAARTKNLERTLELQKKQKKIIQEQNQQKYAPEVINGDHTEIDINRLVLMGEVTDGWASNAKDYLSSKKAVNAETDPLVYMDIRDMQTGDKTRDDGSRFSVQEIQERIMEEGARSNLSQSDMMTLNDKNYKKDDDVLKTASKKVKAYADRTIGGEFSEESLTGEAKGAIEELMFQFYKTVDDRNASGDNIYKIADEIITEHKLGLAINSDTISNDPEEVRKKEMLPINSKRIDPKTFDILNLNDRGEWEIIGNMRTQDAEE